MALNFGLGFSFGASDRGLSRALNSLSSEFKSLGKEMLSLQRLQTMLAAMSFDKLDALSDKLKTLGSGGMELTSSFESTMAGYSKEMRKFGALAGKSGKELSAFSAKASSMAYGLNISADVAGKAIYGFEAAYEELDATGKKTGKKFSVSEVFKQMGIDSAATLAKFTEVTGTSGDEFSYSLMNIAKSTGMGAQGMGQLTDMIVAFGEKSKTVPESLGKIDEIGSLLSKRKLLGDSPEQLEQFSKGIVSVAESFYAYKQDGKKAMQVAMDVANAITTNKDEFQKLQAGAANALPELTSLLGKAGMGVEQAFKSMGQSPDEFLKTFAQGVGQLAGPEQEAALNFFSKHVGSVFGESSETIVSMLKSAEGRAALMNANVGKLVKDSAGAAGKLAKEGYSSGLTAAELFERQQTAFMQRFRNLTTVSTGVFLKETQKSFNAFAGLLERTASEGGPLGGLVRRMADVQKFGAAGLFPTDMQGPLVALGSTAEALLSPMAKLRAAGINLTSPFGLLTAGVGALSAKFLSLKAAGMSTDDALAAVGKDVLKFLTQTLPSLAGKAVKTLATALRGLLTGSWRQAADGSASQQIGIQIVDALRESFKQVWSFLKEAAGGLMKGLRGELDANSASDAEIIGGSLGVTFRKAFDFLKEELKAYFKGWWKDVTDIWADPSTTFSDKVEDTFLTSLPLIGTGLAVAMSPLGGIIGSLLGVFSSLTRIVFSVISSMGNLFSIVSKVWTFVSESAAWEGLLGLFEGVTAGTVALYAVIAALIALTAGFIFFPDQTQSIVDWLSGALKEVGKMLGYATAWIAGAIVYALVVVPMEAFGWLLSNLDTIAYAFGDAVNALLTMLRDLVTGALEGIRDALMEMFPSAAAEIEMVFNAIITVWEGLVNAVELGVTIVTQLIGTVIMIFERTLGTAWNLISGFGTVIWEWVKAFGDAIWGAIKAVADTIYQLMPGVFDSIGNALSGVGAFFKQVFDGIGDGIKGFFTNLVTFGTDMINFVKEGFESIRKWIKDFFNDVDEAIETFASWLLPEEAQKKRQAAKEAAIAAEAAKKKLAAASPPAAAAKPPAAPATPAAAGAPSGAPTAVPGAKTAPAVAAVTVNLAAGQTKAFKSKFAAPKAQASPLAAAPGAPALAGQDLAGALTTTKGKVSPADETQSRKMDTALLDAMNHPAWTDAHLAELKAQKELLQQLVQLLPGTARSGGASPAKPAAKSPGLGATTPVPAAR